MLSNKTWLTNFQRIEDLSVIKVIIHYALKLQKVTKLNALRFFKVFYFLKHNNMILLCLWHYGKILNKYTIFFLITLFNLLIIKRPIKIFKMFNLVTHGIPVSNFVALHPVIFTKSCPQTDKQTLQSIIIDQASVYQETPSPRYSFVDADGREEHGSCREELINLQRLY